MDSPPSPTDDSAISAETLLAVRRYNQEVASYTLRQWNVAKLESEKKERDRRRRRADVLAQRQQTANAAGAGTGHSSNGVGNVHGNPASAARPSAHTVINSGHRHSDGTRPKTDGPLMMVSRRRSERSDRDRGGMSGSTSSGPAQSGYRPSHDHPRYEYATRTHSIHSDIEHLSQMTLKTQDAGAAQSTSVVKHIAKPESSSAQAVDPDTDFSKPATNHIEAATLEMTLAFDDANPYIPVEDVDEGPLPPPPPVWQHRRSGSTPPIPIPRPTAAVSHRSDVGPSSSNSNSAVSARSASPARALGFSAHLGMTSISGAPSAALTDSASTSNPTSEGSSRMSSFSEHCGGFKQGVSRKTPGEEATNPALRPKRHHRSSLASVEPTVAERVDVSGPRLIEGAIGTLRRMTVSGGERAIFGPLE